MKVSDSVEPRVLSRAEHSFSRKQVDDNALKVLYRLSRAGKKAYVVGGGVRDVLLGLTPKDFDISTDARPEDVRRLFRNSRIIGRRFRLVHVFFQTGVVEVSTFRAAPDPDAQRGGPSDLLITDDNVFGSPREDAFRRDFTINALFYDISTFSVIDYVGGIEHLEMRLIETIGDPDLRFCEDPVRMMRACELAGRLDFSIAPATQEAIQRHHKELDKAAPARVTEELIEILRCGRAGTALDWMQDLGLLDVLVPELAAIPELDRRGLGPFDRLTSALDRLAAADGGLSDCAVLASILLPAALLRRFDREQALGRPLKRGQIKRMVEELVATFAARFQLSRFRAEGVLDALIAFHRLGETTWAPAEKGRFVRRQSFRDALVLLGLLAEVTGEGGDALERWQAYSDLPVDEPVRPVRRRRRRRRRRR